MLTTHKEFFPFSLASDHCLAINMGQIYLFESREELSISSVNFDFHKWRFFLLACNHRTIINTCGANMFESRRVLLRKLSRVKSLPIRDKPYCVMKFFFTGQEWKLSTWYHNWPRSLSPDTVWLLPIWPCWHTGIWFTYYFSITIFR